jgi:transposase
MLCKDRISVSYSEAFKMQVISELESGKLPSLEAARRAYGIGGSATIHKWLAKYGRNDLRAKVIRVETPKQRDEVKKLKQKIRQLEEALAQTQIDKLISESQYEVLCEDVGVDPDEFKKKVDVRPSKKLSKNRRKRNR